MGELKDSPAPADSGGAIVEVEGLVKRYRKGKTNAVDGISFSVRKGDFFAFLGPNGAGKTTTISILTTTLIPTSGQVRIAGIFNPIKVLPPYLEILSRISPMRYAVDLVRGAFYGGRPEFARAVLDPPLLDLAVMAGMFAVFLVVGTALFVRNERNR